MGFIAGGVVGGVLGYAISYRSEGLFRYTTDDSPAIFGAFLGATIGGAIGAGAGADTKYRMDEMNPEAKKKLLKRLFPNA